MFPVTALSMPSLAANITMTPTWSNQKTPSRHGRSVARASRVARSDGQMSFRRPGRARLARWSSRPYAGLRVHRVCSLRGRPALPASANLTSSVRGTTPSLTNTWLSVTFDSATAYTEAGGDYLVGKTFGDQFRRPDAHAR